MNKLPPPILITGCARSGTSMVAGVINLCGAFGGRMSPPNKYNEKGMFENVRIRETLTKPYLDELGADPMGQYPLPDINTLPIPSNWGQEVERIIIEEGYGQGTWMYKGAKMCLVWPVWDYAFPKAKWIIVRRRTEDITTSCQKTSFMRAFRSPEIQQMVGAKDEREGWGWWVRQHESRFAEMIQAGLNVKVIWPERMVDGDYSQIYEMLDWLGLPWKSEVLSFVDPKLFHARQKEATLCNG